MKCCATCERTSCIWVNTTHRRYGCELWAPDAVARIVLFNEELRRRDRWYRKLWRAIKRSLLNHDAQDAAQPTTNDETRG